MKKRFSRSPRSTLSWRQRLAKRLLTLPDGLLSFSTGGAIVVDGQTLDPALAALCRFANRRARLHLFDPPKARLRLAGLSSLLPKAEALMDRVEERRIPGPGGELGLRIYTPPDLRREPPSLVYFHGGGWVLGDLDSCDAFCRLIASQVPCKVISVDYRLAPEHPFPAAVDDAMAAFRWTVENARELKIDPRRIAVGGDSAGGNLAAIVASQSAASSENAPGPCAQFLIYPVTSARRDTASYGLFAEGFVLERALMDYFFEHYLDGVDPEDARISPLEGTDFGGLPPTVIATAGFDVLRDEGEAYAEEVRGAGVTVVHRRYPSLMHSFAAMSGLRGPRQAIDAVISDLATLFHRQGSA